MMAEMRYATNAAVRSLLALTCFAQSAEVSFVTSDIDSFWRAYEAGRPGSRRDAAGGFFERFILKAA
jgi:hypothetical protein